MISDGELNKNELKRSGKSEDWLQRELKKQNIDKITSVFIASLDMENQLYIQLKGERDEK